MAEEELIREDTMLYRLPEKDSDPTAVHEIWGKSLETRVVDASEVARFIKDGWSTHPPHVDAPAKPAAQTALEQMIPDLTADLGAANKRIADLESDLKAATELADAESKAKDAALARAAELEKAASSAKK